MVTEWRATMRRTVESSGTTSSLAIERGRQPKRLKTMRAASRSLISSVRLVSSSEPSALLNSQTAAAASYG
jgi:hypothetical protein